MQRCLITVKEGGSFRSRGRPYTAIARPNGPFYDNPRSRKKLTNTPGKPRSKSKEIYST